MSEDNPSGEDNLVEDFEDLYENAPCGYLSIRPNGRIFKANLTFASWIGFSREQLVGKRLVELLNLPGRIYYETHFVPLLRLQGFFDEVAFDLETQSGSRIPVLVNARERREMSGQHLFTRLTIFNATVRRHYERQLLASRTAAEESEKRLEGLRAVDQRVLLDERATAALREQFIAVLGHDLRNPLTGVMGGMELLLRTPLNDRAKAIVGMVQNSASRMAGLIDNVMDFARGRLSGGLSLAREGQVNIEPVLRNVIAELQMTWPAQKFETDFSIADSLDCDPGRISQLLSNLLGNALSHGAPGEPIRIMAHTDGAKFHLSVANAGKPIPAEARERLFEPFFRGEVRESQQGLGLGLYIISQIARAHGGEIEVASDVTETRFSFRMPVNSL